VTFDILPAYFQQRLEPALRKLLESALAAGEARTSIAAMDLFRCGREHEDLTARLRELTAGKGVERAIDCVAGELG
jgi:hypothetical protein